MNGIVKRRSVIECMNDDGDVIGVPASVLGEFVICLRPGMLRRIDVPTVDDC